jgi:hypothetical protein
MPKFVYKPEGAEPRSWDFAPEKMMSAEMIVVEDLTGLTWGEWIDACARGSIKAIHALLYVLLKRATPTLRPDEVQFTLDEIDFEDDPTPAPKGQKKGTKSDA